MTEQEARLAIFLAMLTRKEGLGAPFREVATFIAASAKFVMGGIDADRELPMRLRIIVEAAK